MGGNAAARAGNGATKGGRPVVEEESMSSYFRGVFKAHPHLLDSRSNDELLAHWINDHPGREAELDRVRANLANIKSVLRNKRRRRRGGRKPAEAAAGEAPAPAKLATRSLEALEERIDDCLVQARGLDREGLVSIISLLRRARNAVVWKMGEKETP
jgi:hypothetical protein